MKTKRRKMTTMRLLSVSNPTTMMIVIVLVTMTRMASLIGSLLLAITLVLALHLVRFRLPRVMVVEANLSIPKGQSSVTNGHGMGTY